MHEPDVLECLQLDLRTTSSNQPSRTNEGFRIRTGVSLTLVLILVLISGTEDFFAFAGVVFCCSLAFHLSGLFDVSAVVVFAMLLFSRVPVCVCVRTMNKTLFLDFMC